MNYEGLRVIVGDVATLTMPSDVAGLGPNLSVVDACNALNPAQAAPGAPGNKINPLSAELAGLNSVTCTVTPASPSFENVFPFGNSATSNTIIPNIPSPIPLNNGLFKADYNIGQHHHLNGLFYISKSQNLTTSATTVLPQYATGAINNSHQYDGNWTWTPNSTWVNDFRLGLVYIADVMLHARPERVLGRESLADGFMRRAFSGVTNPLYGGLPQITITGFTGVLGGGGSLRTGSRGPQGDVDLVDNVSYLRGNHSFKFGFEYLDVLFDGDAFPGAYGSAVFSNLQNFLQGIPNSGSIYLGNPQQKHSGSLAFGIRSG